MILVVGLGNPGPEYEKNRHNVGYLVVDKLHGVKSPGVIVKKSGVYMNESGEFVRNLMESYGLDASSLYVIHDDLDIPLGSYKIQFEKGPKDHNGIRDIEAKLGTKGFWRVRVGIEDRPDGSEISGEEYVLEDFTDDQSKKIQGVFARLIPDLKKRLTSIL